MRSSPRLKLLSTMWRRGELPGAQAGLGDPIQPSSGLRRRPMPLPYLLQLPAGAFELTEPPPPQHAVLVLVLAAARARHTGAAGLQATPALERQEDNGRPARRKSRARDLKRKIGEPLTLAGAWDFGRRAPGGSPVLRSRLILWAHCRTATTIA